MYNKLSLRNKLLVLTVGLNVISFLFCGLMITQVKGTLNSAMLVVALVGLLGWAIYSFLFISKMGERFSIIISQISKDSTEMGASVKDISDASNRLAQATTEQASALQETAASIEEMNAMIKKSSESAQRSREVATVSYDVANKGKESVDEMVTAIEDIHTSNNEILRAVDTSQQEFEEIVRVITEIGQKTKVINDIVFQTKLLSFNASVEAARAGEHGKGFAVVAEEVGNLAQMSGNAAKEISEMLEGSILKVQGIVNNTRHKVGGLISQGKKRVEVGSSVARTCGKVLEEVVRNVTTLNLMVDEISTSSHEQSQGISEITRAINQLDQVTHSHAITSQQTATSATQLDAQTKHLNQYVEEFRSVIQGDVESKRLFKGQLQARSKKTSEPLPFLKKQDSKPHTQDYAAASGADVIPSHDDPRFKDV